MEQTTALPRKTHPEYLECEKPWVFHVLILVAGFYGGYTLSVRGGVFCNAQTANLALLAVAVGQGNWAKAGYYLIPISAYILGTVVSEAVPKPLRKLRFLRWDTVLTLIEMILVAVIGFIPASAPNQICQVLINFICAMQYNTFRSAEGVAMATTFCTAHIRQFGMALTRLLRKDPLHPDAKAQVLAHGGMILCFLAGVLVSTLLCRVMGTCAIWCALAPLAVLFVDLCHADLKTERDELDRTPHGH